MYWVGSVTPLKPLKAVGRPVHTFMQSKAGQAARKAVGKVGKWAGNTGVARGWRSVKGFGRRLHDRLPSVRFKRWAVNKRAALNRGLRKLPVIGRVFRGYDALRGGVSKVLARIMNFLGEIKKWILRALGGFLLTCFFGLVICMAFTACMQTVSGFLEDLGEWDSENKTRAEIKAIAQDLNGMDKDYYEAINTIRNCGRDDGGSLAKISDLIDPDNDDSIMNIFVNNGTKFFYDGETSTTNTDVKGGADLMMSVSSDVPEPKDIVQFGCPIDTASLEGDLGEDDDSASGTYLHFVSGGYPTEDADFSMRQEDDATFEKFVEPDADLLGQYSTTYHNNTLEILSMGTVFINQNFLDMSNIHINWLSAALKLKPQKMFVSTYVKNDGAFAFLRDLFTANDGDKKYAVGFLQKYCEVLFDRSHTFKAAISPIYQCATSSDSGIENTHNGMEVEIVKQHDLVLKDGTVVIHTVGCEEMPGTGVYGVYCSEMDNNGNACAKKTSKFLVFTRPKVGETGNDAGGMSDTPYYGLQQMYDNCMTGDVILAEGMPESVGITDGSGIPDDYDYTLSGSNITQGQITHGCKSFNWTYTWTTTETVTDEDGDEVQQPVEHSATFRICYCPGHNIAYCPGHVDLNMVMKQQNFMPEAYLDMNDMPNYFTRYGTGESDLFELDPGYSSDGNKTDVQIKYWNLIDPESGDIINYLFDEVSDTPLESVDDLFSAQYTRDGLLDWTFVRGSWNHPKDLNVEEFDYWRSGGAGSTKKLDEWGEEGAVDTVTKNSNPYIYTWNGWDTIHICAAIDVYNQDWEELYDIPMDELVTNNISVLGGSFVNDISAAERERLRNTMVDTGDKFLMSGQLQLVVEYAIEAINHRDAFGGKIGYDQSNRDYTGRGQGDARYDEYGRVNTNNTLDCSSFVSWLYNAAGYSGFSSPYNTVSLMSTFEEYEIEKEQLLPGDFIIREGLNGKGNHASIYIGPGEGDTVNYISDRDSDTGIGYTRNMNVSNTSSHVYHFYHLPTSDDTARNFEATNEDLYWMTFVILNEAEGQSDLEKMRVGLVVKNRVRSGSFPNTVKEVILQVNDKGEHQYSLRLNTDGSVGPSHTDWASCEVAARRVLSGENPEGMPESVIYQARFKQGPVWMGPPDSPHYYCSSRYG